MPLYPSGAEDIDEQLQNRVSEAAFGLVDIQVCLFNPSKTF